MYSDKKKKHTIIIVIVILVLAVFGLIWTFAGSSGQDIREESSFAIQEAVRRSALQCYVVEGIYPPDLAYLEENYGLQVNTDDYYVTYSAYASNLPPDIIVTAK